MWAWRVWLALTGVAVVGHFVVPGRTSVLVYTVHVVCTLVVVVGGVVVHGPVYRRVWSLLVGAQAAFAVANVGYTFEVLVLDRVPAPGGVVSVLEVAAIVLMLVTALSLVVQGADGDRGGVLDSAVLAVAGGTLLWELVVYPAVAGAGAAAMTVYMVQVLCLTGVAGALVRIAVVCRSSRATLGFFAAALVCALVATVGYLVTYGLGRFDAQNWTDPLWYGVTGSLGAAALHPAMAHLGLDRRVIHERLHDRRLLALTAALLCAPVVVGISTALERGTDTILLTASLVIMVPLVMTRIRGLVQEREAAQTALAYQATHDALTGLLNRAALLDRLDAARDRVASGTSPGLCLIFLDLDGFKQVNDTFGHAAGDRLLAVVAQRVRACVRSVDAVARLGGDEFVVLWEQADADTAQVVAARLDHMLRRPVQLDAGVARVGVSIGVVTGIGPSICEGTALLGSADAAMYRAKRATRRHDRAAVTP